MPLTPLLPTSERYYLRQSGGAVTGPFPPSAILALLSEGKLDGSAEVSRDRQVWAPVQTLAPAGPTPDRTAPLDLGDDDADGILLAPLELGFGPEPEASPAAASAPPPRDAGAPSTQGDPSPQAEEEGLELGAALELEERDPPSAHAPAAAPPGRPPEPARPPADASPPVAGTLNLAALSPTRPAAERSEASSTMASLLDAAEAHSGDDDGRANQPLRLDEVLTAPAEVKPARLRTLTAARGGHAGWPVPPPPARWRPSRRLVLTVAGLGLLGAAGIATIVFDLPDRLRGEPAREAVLGPVAAQIARDRFAAFSEGARLLEEAAGVRRHTPATRAGAAELLASSVVIHGGERGRIVHAEALLEVAKEPAREEARVARNRARAWVALSKGRWREAEELAAGNPALPATDRAVLQAWAAFGREDATRATKLFQAALQGEPPPRPSRAAALYGLARAREADLDATAEAAFRAVLAEAPDHAGAALGLARLSRLSAAGRLKLADAVIAKQAGGASRVELAEAHVVAARAARELGQTARTEAALARARQVDPSGAAAAVFAGDVLLAEGRTDEAVSRYKAALAPPAGTARTSSLRFARVAALVESARRAEGIVALDQLDRRLPGDVRVAFWRGRAAERAQPADLAAAERAYRDAVQRDPRYLPATLQLARLLLDQQRSKDALAILRSAEKSGAAAAPLRLALGQALLASGNAAEAARTFRQELGAPARSIAAPTVAPTTAPTTAAASTGIGLPANAAAPAPSDAEVRLGLASALEAQGNLEGARAELAALAARGEVPGLRARMAGLLVKLGRKPEALASYRKYIEGGAAPPSTKVAAARLALELGQRDVARQWAEGVVSEDPRTPGALLVLAEVRRADGDLGSALAELRRALAVDGSPEVQLEYGRALAALGRDEDALAALARAQDIPEAAVDRGRIFLRRGDTEAAAKELAAATARLPTQAEAFLLLGKAEERLGHPVQAEAAWRSAVRLAPTSSEARYRLGRLEMDRGLTSAALPHLRSALAHLPRFDERAPRGDAAWRDDLYFQLGFAELRRGARDRALSAFKRYLELAPPDAPARGEVTRQIAELSR